jgi:tetratricopeptide (TPR) repeat protein
MQLCLKSVVSALVLIAGTGYAPAALAEAPPPVEKPNDQSRAGASRAAIERERRYAGLTLAESIRQSLIDDDLDFAFSTMTALGQATGDEATGRYFNGIRAFARGDFAESLDILRTADTEDMMVASLRAWALVGDNKAQEAVRVWDTYGDSGRKPFYATYRALLAEQSGQTDVALRNYRIAASTGELVLAKDLARRYAVLLVKSGKDREALRMFDDIFGETKALDLDETAFRQGLVTKRPAALPAISPRSAMSAILSDYAFAGMFVRMLRPEDLVPAEADNKSKGQKKATGDTQAEAQSALPQTDADTLFVSDALTLRTALLIDPSNVAARFGLASLFSEIDEDEAIQKVLEPVSAGPRVNEARRYLASAYDSMENPARGLQVLESIPEASRDSGWWDQRSDLLNSQGNYAQALVAARRSVAMARGKGEWAEDLAQISLANALNYSGQEAEARAMALAMVNRLEKRNPLRGAAADLLTQYEPTRAIGLAAARESLTAVGANGRTKISVGNALLRDPTTKAEGIVLMREGARDYPYSASVMNAVGYNLIEYDIDLEEGFRILQKAHQVRPNSGAIMDSYGRANYRLGNLDEAQRLIEGAIALRIGCPDPEIYDNLGDVYWHQGRKDDARAQWRRAKEIGGAYEKHGALDGKIRDGLTTPAPTRREVPTVAEPGSV